MRLSCRSHSESRAAAVVAGLGILGSAAPARAYRPFDGTDAAVAETGTIELELGVLQLERTDGTVGYIPNGVFNAGVAHNFELVVDLARDDDALASDLLIKHVIRRGGLQGGTGPSLAIETGILFPTLPAHSTDAGWSFAVIGSQVWDAVTVHVNLEGVYGRYRDLDGIASVIVEGPEAWPVRPVAEVLASTETGNTRSALAGAIWRATDDLAVDAALRFVHDGVRTGDRDAIELRAGLTWAFKP